MVITGCHSILPQSHTVPQANLVISQNNQFAYNGTQLSLTCTITLNNEAAAFTSDVEIVWKRANQILGTDVSACTTISSTTRVSEATFQSILMFDPLGNESRNGGVYTCEVDMISGDNTIFITPGSSSTSHTLDVIGKELYALVNALKIDTMQELRLMNKLITIFA